MLMHRYLVASSYICHKSTPFTGAEPTTKTEEKKVVTMQQLLQEQILAFYLASYIILEEKRDKQKEKEN